MNDPFVPQPTRERVLAPRERGVVSTRLRVVVVNDELPLRRTLARMLATHGFEVRTCDDGTEAIASIEAEPADVMLLDVDVPRLGWMEVLRRAKQIRPDLEVVVLAGTAEMETAVSAVRAGAYDFVAKPFSSPDAVILVVERAAERRSLVERGRRLEETLRSEEPTGELVGSSPAMLEVKRIVAGVAQSPSPVLLHGEGGVGKEFIARIIHREGPRAGRPFVPVHCAAIPEAILEGELFGWTRGSILGGAANREGLFDAANGGTIFLDEVSSLPGATQAKLLRVVQEGETRPVGSNDVRRVDTRVIAATTVDLKEVVQRGAFREDLFYRLQVVRIAVPALRDRRGDIPLLATHFLRKYAQRLARDVQRFSPEAIAELEGRPWPGNVRELENVVERAVVLAPEDVIRREDLPAPEPAAGPDGVSSLPDLTLLPFREAKAIALQAFEREYVSALLRRTNGNVTQAARRAELDRSNFRRLIRKCER